MLSFSRGPESSFLERIVPVRHRAFGPWRHRPYFLARPVYLAGFLYIGFWPGWSFRNWPVEDICLLKVQRVVWRLSRASDPPRLFLLHFKCTVSGSSEQVQAALFML